MPSLSMRRATDVSAAHGGSGEQRPPVTPFLLGTAVGTALGALLAIGAGQVSQRVQAGRPAIPTATAASVEAPHFEVLLQ